MADTKISALTALAGSGVDQLADVLAIVDTSVTTTKKILVSELSQAMLVLGTENTTTGGTSVDYTIPAWAKQVTLTGSAVSTNGTSPLMVQLGDAGGIEGTVTYSGGIMETVASGSAGTLNTIGFLLHTAAVAADAYDFTVVLTLKNAATFQWICDVKLYKSSGEARVAFGGGVKATSQAMSTVRLTTFGGVNTFDAMAVNVLYE